MQNSKEQLSPPEWMAIASVLCVLIILTLIAWRRDEGAFLVARAEPRYTVDPRIEVFVEGAVEVPRRLVVNRGTTVQEVLEQVTLLPEADVAKLKGAAKVRRGQHIRVPEKKKGKGAKKEYAG